MSVTKFDLYDAIQRVRKAEKSHQASGLMAAFSKQPGTDFQNLAEAREELVSAYEELRQIKLEIEIERQNLSATANG